MKTGKFVAAIVGLALTTGAYAQSSTGSTTTSTTSSKSLYQKLKDGPVSLRFSLNADVNRKSSGANAGKTSGYTFTNMAYLGYKITDKDSLRMETRWSANKKFGAEEGTEHSFSRLVLKYSRRGLLNQKDHGINLSAGIERRILPDHEARTGRNRYGNNRVSLSASRSFDNGFSLSSSFLATKIDLRNEDESNMDVLKSTNHYYLLYTTQAYSITDKLSISFTQEWGNSHKVGNGQLDDKGNRITESFWVDAYLEVGYQLTPQISTALSMSIPITAGHDGEKNDGNFFIKNIQDKVAFSGNLSISAF